MFALSCKSTPKGQTSGQIKVDTAVKETIQKKDFSFSDTAYKTILSRDTVQILPFEAEVRRNVPFFKWTGTKIDTVFDTIKIKYNQPKNLFNVEYKARIDTLRDTIFHTQETKHEPQSKTSEFYEKLLPLLLILVLSYLLFLAIDRRRKNN